MQPFEITQTLIDSQFNQRQTHFIGIRKSYFLLILIMLTIVSISFFSYSLMIYTEKQNYFKNISNLFCIFLDDIIYPNVLAHFCMIFAPILIIMGIYDREPICIVVSFCLKVFTLFQFYNAKNQIEAYSARIKSMTCLDEITLETIQILYTIQSVVCAVLLLFDSLLFINIKKIRSIEQQ